MKTLFLIIVISVFSSCSHNSSLEAGADKQSTRKQIGKPDSIIEKEGIPDVYTNKLIKMEIWYYGTDTSIVFADDKIQTISIKK